MISDRIGKDLWKSVKSKIDTVLSIVGAISIIEISVFATLHVDILQVSSTLVDKVAAKAAEEAAGPIVKREVRDVFDDEVGTVTDTLASAIKNSISELPVAPTSHDIREIVADEVSQVPDETVIREIVIKELSEMEFPTGAEVAQVLVEGLANLDGDVVFVKTGDIRFYPHLTTLDANHESYEVIDDQEIATFIEITFEKYRNALGFE